MIKTETDGDSGSLEPGDSGEGKGIYRAGHCGRWLHGELAIDL